MAQKRRRRRKMSRKRRRQIFFLRLSVVAVAVLMVLGGLYLYLRKYVSKYPENKVVENIYVGSIDAGNMTSQELKTALEEYLETKKATKVTLLVDDKKEAVTLGEFGIGYENIDELVKNAVAYGNKGSLWERYRALKDVAKEKLVLEENYVIDEEAVKTILNEKAVPITNHAVNATISKYSGGFSITNESEGETVDVKKTVGELKSFLNNSWDYKDFSLEVVLKKENPTVTAAQLETIRDELGTFSTDAGGGTRWQNLKTGIGKVNGTVLMPGEELSIHNITAPYDEEHGYVAASSYENGQVVETYGGGICQVSSTVYNAVLFAELEIVERYPHSMMVSYVEPSKDAAIAGDYKDLVFKNNYETPIYIEGKIDDANQLTVTIYGKETRDANREVKYESETISTTEYGTVYEADSGSSIGSMQGGGSPHTGKEARLWKVVYENGKEVSRDNINYSNYNKSDYIIKVGTASSVSQASSIVANAIATQDEGKIRQAINEAQALERGGSQ